MGLKQKHQVRRGETLWRLSKKYLGKGSRWRELAAANPDVDPRRMRIGAMLAIPMAAGGAHFPPTDMDFDPGTVIERAQMPEGIERGVSAGRPSYVDQLDQPSAGLDPFSDMAMGQIERAGRGGDTELGHLTPGEVVLPQSILRDPQVSSVIAEAFRRQGIDFGRYMVGGQDDSINPETGAREFYDPSFEGGGAGNQDNSIVDTTQPGGNEPTPVEAPAAVPETPGPQVAQATVPTVGADAGPNYGDIAANIVSQVPGVEGGADNVNALIDMTRGDGGVGAEPSVIDQGAAGLHPGSVTPGYTGNYNFPPGVRMGPDGRVETMDATGKWVSTHYTPDDLAKALNPDGLLGAIGGGGQAGIYGGTGSADPAAARGAVDMLEAYRPISDFEYKNYDQIVQGLGGFINTLASQGLGFNLDKLLSAKSLVDVIGAAPKGIGAAYNLMTKGEVPMGGVLGINPDTGMGMFGHTDAWARDPANYTSPAAYLDAINDGQAVRSEEVSPGRAEAVNEVLNRLFVPRNTTPPGSLGLDTNFGGLTNLQQRAQIATYGTQGTGSTYRDVAIQRYYRDLLNNALQGGKIGLDALLPVELQYLSQIMGAPVPSSSEQLLRDIASV